MAEFVGYHLPMCICSVADDVIPIDQVERIYSDSTAQTDAEWETQFTKYTGFWWFNQTESRLAVARQLLADSKIDQPLLRGEAIPPLPDPGSVWTEDGQLIPTREMTERYSAIRGETE